MKAKKYAKGGPITPDPKKKAPVGGVAQRTKAEETAFEERRIEGMRESLREGEGLKALQDYDKELAAKGYSFPNGSSIKVKKYEAGGMVGGDPKKTPKYANAEDYYMNEGQHFLAQALKERNVAGRKGTGEDVKTMWEGVKKSNPRLANELLQRAKQFRMESGGEYSIKTAKAPGYSY
jgi:hypothetical protein